VAKRILWWTAAASTVVIALVAVTYLRDMSQAYERVRGKSTVVPTPYGDIEYTEGGSGPSVLVIHGGGGGYDQGELIAQTVLGDRFHWIAPSRFGYLGSAMPEGATWDDQAHAYAYLLDRLNIDRVAVVAMSQGGASALLFALLHPERVSSLTCLSCGVAASRTVDQAGADRKGRMLRSIFTFDLPYWAVSKLFKKQFLGLIGADRAIIANLTPTQREAVDHFIVHMNPASPRSVGAAFDNVATLPGDRIAAITAPTLISHARDDRLQLFHNAEFAASAIRGARLLSFETGGHILMIVEQATIRATVQQHILTHAGQASPF
jgi:2-hydroxy-6-oxonona-2,4-dienedioate hydrolase